MHRDEGPKEDTVVEDPETHVDGSQDEGEEVEFFKSARQVLYCPSA